MRSTSARPSAVRALLIGLVTSEFSGLSIPMFAPCKVSCSKIRIRQEDGFCHFSTCDIFFRMYQVSLRDPGLVLRVWCFLLSYVPRKSEDDAAGLRGPLRLP
jgi:hypothetical protein